MNTLFMQRRIYSFFSNVLLGSFGVLLVLSCNLNENKSETQAPKVQSLPNETDVNSTVEAVSLDSASHSYIDIRGVGDSAWSNTHEKSPRAAKFGNALDTLDPTGESYNGDINFMNWESVVAESCQQFSAPYSPGNSYAFVSRSLNIEQAIEKGFNLFGLSNNHTRDCVKVPSVGSGSTATANAFKTLEKEFDILHHGVTGTGVALRKLTVKGREIRIAFASVYNGRNDVCSEGVCGGQRLKVLAGLRDAKADLRILAIHSQASQPDLVELATKFVEQYKGDVVFGSGPHVWAPVRVLRQEKSQKRGVIFESLGNFIHPGLGGQNKNMIGRLLLNPVTLNIEQVQVIPVSTKGAKAWLSYETVSGTSVPANLNLKPSISTKGAYANLLLPKTAVSAAVVP